MSQEGEEKPKITSTTAEEAPAKNLVPSAFNPAVTTKQQTSIAASSPSLVLQLTQNSNHLNNVTGTASPSNPISGMLIL
jgi:hypothetical protein